MCVCVVAVSNVCTLQTGFPGSISILSSVDHQTTLLPPLSSYTAFSIRKLVVNVVARPTTWLNLHSSPLKSYIGYVVCRNLRMCNVKWHWTMFRIKYNCTVHCTVVFESKHCPRSVWHFCTSLNFCKPRTCIGPCNMLYGPMTVVHICRNS